MENPNSESIPQNEKLKEFLYSSFATDPYNKTGGGFSVVSEARPDLAEEYCVSSLGYVLVDAELYIRDYLGSADKEEEERYERYEDLLRYLGHNLSRAQINAGYTRKINNSFNELADLIGDLYKTAGRLESEKRETYYTEALEKITRLQSELNLKPADRFVLGEKLGIKREEAIVGYLRKRLEGLTGYVHKEQKFMSEIFGKDRERAIPADDVNVQNLIKDAFNPDLPSSETLEKIKTLFSMADKNRGNKIEMAEYLRDMGLLLSMVDNIMEAK